MLSKTAYLETRAIKIEEAQAIFSKTIINRLLNAKIKGETKRKCFKTLGKVIDYVKDNKLNDVVSLTKRQRQEILDYLNEIGVIEFLGIENGNFSTLN